MKNTQSLNDKIVTIYADFITVVYYSTAAIPETDIHNEILPYIKITDNIRGHGNLYIQYKPDRNKDGVITIMSGSMVLDQGVISGDINAILEGIDNAVDYSIDINGFHKATIGTTRYNTLEDLIKQIKQENKYVAI